MNSQLQKQLMNNLNGDNSTFNSKGFDGLNLNPGQVISAGPSIGIGIYYSPSWLRW